jgi:hypothetical protein
MGESDFNSSELWYLAQYTGTRLNFGSGRLMVIIQSGIEFSIQSGIIEQYLVAAANICRADGRLVSRKLTVHCTGLLEAIG